LTQSGALDHALLKVLLIFAVIRALAAAFDFLLIHAGHEFWLGGHPAIGQIALADRAVG
jgi:hypothetical protein